MTKYAIHNSGKAGFTLKKLGDSGNNDFRTQANSSVPDNVAVIYGTSLAKELIEFKHEDQGEKILNLESFMYRFKETSIQMIFLGSFWVHFSRSFLGPLCPSFIFCAPLGIIWFPITI